MGPQNMEKPGAANPPNQDRPKPTFSEQVLFLVPYGKRDAFRSWYQYATAVKASSVNAPSMWKTGALSLPEFVLFDDGSTEAEDEEDEERDVSEPMPMQVFGGTLRQSGSLGGSDPLFTTGSHQQSQKSSSDTKMKSVFHYCGDMWLMEEKLAVDCERNLLEFCQGCAICTGKSADAQETEQRAQQPADLKLWETVQVADYGNQHSGGTGIDGETTNVLHYYNDQYVIERRSRDPAQPFLMMNCGGCSRCDTQWAYLDSQQESDESGGLDEDFRGGLKAPSAAAGFYEQTTGALPTRETLDGTGAAAGAHSVFGASTRSKKRWRPRKNHRMRHSEQEGSQQAAGFSGAALPRLSGPSKSEGRRVLHEETTSAVNAWTEAESSAPDRRAEHLWPDGANGGAFRSIERRFERTEGGSRRSGSGFHGGRSTKSV